MHRPKQNSVLALGSQNNMVKFSPDLCMKALLHRVVQVNRLSEALTRVSECTLLYQLSFPNFACLFFIFQEVWSAFYDSYHLLVIVSLAGSYKCLPQIDLSFLIGHGIFWFKYE